MLYFYSRSSCVDAALTGNYFPNTEHKEWQQSCHEAPKKYNATPEEKPQNYTGSEEEWTELFQSTYWTPPRL